MSEIPAEGLLSSLDIQEITHLAEGLTEDEVSLYLWGVPYAELPEHLLPEFRRAYTRGRTQFKVFAINALKSQMHGRQGLQASLGALIRFADAWQPIDDQSIENGTFNFQINLAKDE